MSKFATLTGTSAAGRSHQEIALQAVEAARMPVDIDDFTRSRRKGVVLLASNEGNRASTGNTDAVLTNNEDDSYMATQENSSASTNPQETTHTPIPGYPGYEATSDGQIYSTNSNWRGYGIRPLAQDLNESGYPSVRLVVGGKRTRLSVHKLIALAFLPPKPSPKHEVRHLDGNKLNSAACNLMWGTRKENADDREAHGRTSRGERHSRAIKTGLERRSIHAS